MADSEMGRKLPVGIESFEKIRTEGFYYVDKTAMIGDLLRHWGEVNLFTRPRRFGKSLNMSMLKAFFEIGCDKMRFGDFQGEGAVPGLYGQVSCCVGQFKGRGGGQL